MNQQSSHTTTNKKAQNYKVLQHQTPTRQQATTQTAKTPLLSATKPTTLTPEKPRARQP